jgi:superfamily II helicase
MAPKSPYDTLNRKMRSRFGEWLLNRRRDGLDYTEIALLLRDQYGVIVSSSSIARYLKRARDEVDAAKQEQ